MTKCLTGEIDMAFMTELKTAAVNSGELMPAHCEPELASAGNPGKRGQISDDILGRCRAARSQAT